jgi:hypothetical protein
MVGTPCPIHSPAPLRSLTASGEKARQDRNKAQARRKKRVAIHFFFLTTFDLYVVKVVTKGPHSDF